jgi:hypothetical protein
MTEERERAWAEREARAQRLLEHAREVEPRAHVRVYGSLLRLWHYPAFGPQTTWTVLAPGRKAPAGSTPLVRELAWNRDADHRQLFEHGLVAGPSLRLREAPLPAAELERLLATGTSLPVPLFLSGNTVGLDGEYFGLETYAVSPNVRAQWWREGPTEWRHFTDWVAQLREFLRRTLDRSG